MNHGPDDQSPPGLDLDERALRDLLHQAVREVEPRDGTLDHLRKAVPARRARKRQAAVGMAAAALFVATAVPALLHVSGSSGVGADPSIAGHGAQAQGGSGQGKGPDGGEATAGGSSGTTQDKGDARTEEDGKDQATGSTDGSGADSGSDTASTDAAAAPTCTAAELGSATSTVDAPDAAGAVYGTFRFTNAASASCTVSGPGTLTPAAQGAADATRIGAVRHVAGDAAAGLPDPSREVTSLLLKPGASYEVRFAWAPSESCPTDEDDSTGGTGDPSPDPTTTQDTSSTEGGSTSGDTTGTSTQLIRADATTDGSVVVTNTADGGAPSVSATVTDACAGTVYWTGVLPVE